MISKRDKIEEYIKNTILKDLEDYYKLDVLDEDNFWTSAKLQDHHKRHVTYKSLKFNPSFSYINREVRFPSFASQNKVIELNQRPSDEELDDEVYWESVDNYEAEGNKFMNDESITHGFMTKDFSGKYTDYVLMKFRESSNIQIRSSGYIEYVMYEPVYNQQNKLFRRKLISYGLTFRDYNYNKNGALNDYDPVLKVKNTFKYNKNENFNYSTINLTEENLDLDITSNTTDSVIAEYFGDILGDTKVVDNAIYLLWDDFEVYDDNSEDAIPVDRGIWGIYVIENGEVYCCNPYVEKVEDIKNIGNEPLSCFTDINDCRTILNIKDFPTWCESQFGRGWFFTNDELRTDVYDFLSSFGLTEELDLEADPFDYSDYMDRLTRWTEDALLFNIYIAPTGLTGHLKLDDYNMGDYREILLNNNCVTIIGGFDEDIGILLNKEKPTTNQIRIIEKLINHYKPKEVNLYLLNHKTPDASLKDEVVSAPNVSNEIARLFDISETLDLDVAKKTKLKKIPEISINNFDNKEISKLAYYLSEGGKNILKDWAEDNSIDLFENLELREDDDLIISKIKPSYKSTIFADRYYYNIFSENYFGELEWLGQIPKSLGDRLLTLNEDLDLDTREHAKYSVYQHNINFVEYTYLGQEKDKFLEEVLDCGDMLLNTRDIKYLNEYIDKVTKAQLLIRGYNDDRLISVGVGLYNNNFPFKWTEKIVNSEELIPIINCLGIKLPKNDTTDIKVERL